MSPPTSCDHVSATQVFEFMEKVYKQQEQLSASIEKLTTQNEAQDARIKELTGALNAHMSGEEALLEGVIKNFKEGFPEGDASEHRKYHEALTQQIEARRDFWQKLRYEIFKWGIIGALGWGFTVIWRAFLQGPK